MKINGVGAIHNQGYTIAKKSNVDLNIKINKNENFASVPLETWRAYNIDKITSFLYIHCQKK